MKNLLCGVLLVGASLFVAAQQSSPTASKPVPVEDEPHHHLVLKNAFVEVMSVTVPAGESTLFHTHSHDGAAVSLAKSTTTQQKFGEAEGPPGPFELGGLSVRTLSDGPFTHRVHNVGSGPFEVLDVEFLQRPKQPSEPSAPVAAENGSARLYNWILAPGATAAQHRHERPYLIVAVTPMVLTMTSSDGKSFSHEVKPGEFHWIDAKVTHTLANGGSTAGQIVEIELK